MPPLLTFGRLSLLPLRPMSNCSFRNDTATGSHTLHCLAQRAAVWGSHPWEGHKIDAWCGSPCRKEHNCSLVIVSMHQGWADPNPNLPAAEPTSWPFWVKSAVANLAYVERRAGMHGNHTQVLLHV